MLSQELATSTLLGRYRFWLFVAALLHATLWLCWAYNSASLLFDTANQRATTWIYWSIWGNAFGLLSTFAVVWQLYHYAFAGYFWITFIVSLALFVFHAACTIYYGSPYDDCSTTSICFGCNSTINNTVVDSAFIINWVFVALLALFNLFYMFILGSLRARTEFAVYWQAAAEMRTNGNVALVPSPLSPLINQAPTAPGAAASAAFQFQLYLARFRFWATLPVVLHLCALVILAWNFGNLFVDVCNERAFSWEYVQLYGSVLGVFSLFAFYWNLWHATFKGYYYIDWVVQVLTFFWELVCFFSYIGLVSNCSAHTPCSGTTGTADTDWPLRLHWAMVGVLMVWPIVYIVLSARSYNKAQTALFIEVSESSDYDATMREAVSPGMQSADGGYPGVSAPGFVQQMGTPIGGDGLRQRTGAVPRGAGGGGGDELGVIGIGASLGSSVRPLGRAVPREDL